MTSQAIIDLASQSIIVAMKIAAPALISTMVMGLIISIFQAATQINEQTLSFIPKILAMSLALLIAGPWILKTMMIFTTQMIETMAAVTK
jgi:flagellar biosynthetic protein FliQ